MPQDYSSAPQDRGFISSSVTRRGWRYERGQGILCGGLGATRPPLLRVDMGMWGRTAEDYAASSPSLSRKSINLMLETI
jgi:hypothetical protein